MFYCLLLLTKWILKSPKQRTYKTTYQAINLYCKIGKLFIFNFTLQLYLHLNFS